MIYEVIKNKRIAENAMTAAISLILAFFAGLDSPTHPWVMGKTYVDSSIFKTIALMMEKGYMPYKDSFDHHGPFLYILNYLGNKISYYGGIFYIEWICIAITFFSMYKIARLFCGKFPSFVSTMLSFTLLHGYYHGGNLTEEYAMPCIAVSLYVFLRYLKEKRIPFIWVFITGICFGMVLMLRPNMAVVWPTFCIYILGRLLYKKKYFELGRLAGSFLAGSIVFLLPIIIWLGIHKDIQWCIHDYITYNMLYTSTTATAKINVFFWFLNENIYFLSLFGIIYSIKAGDRKYIDIPYLFFFILTIMAMTISGRLYDHYGMIIIPALVYPIARIFEHIEHIERGKVKKDLLLVVSFFSLFAFVLPGWKDTLKTLPEVYANRNIPNLENEETINIVVNLIKQNSSDDDAISVYGQQGIFYVLSQRKHATRYCFQWSDGYPIEVFIDDYFKQLTKEQPKLIIVSSAYLDEKMTHFLEENNYQLLWREDSEDGLSVYQK